MTGSSSGSARTSDDDLIALLIFGTLGFGAAVAAAATWWTKTVAWLLEYQVLVAAATQPTVALPGSAGAGLDVPRLALTAAVLLVLVAGVVSAVRRKVAEGGLQ